MFFYHSKKRIKELENALSEANAKIAKLENEKVAISAIVGSMIEGVIAVDNESRILSLNPAIEQIFDVKASQVKGRFLLEAIRNNDISELISEVLEAGAFISREVSLVFPLQKIFQINVSPLFENNKISGCVAVIHDMSEIRRLEVMRRDFVANVSHELKTPLTSIKGFVETLLDGALEDKANNRNFLEIIQTHVNRLDNLVNDLLELSHLESKEIKLQKESINLRVLADNILSGFKSQLKKKSIDAKNDLGDSLSVMAYKNKIEQVFTNLIDNAIKFNKEKGFIKLYSEGLEGKIKITIEDSGLGIPEKDIPRIFERFYRVDKARSRELGGTGLGLSIVKHIVELHGGNVGVESIEGLGSKFFFTLPK